MQPCAPRARPSLPLQRHPHTHPACCRAALEGLRAPETFFAAVDAVVELIYCTSHRGRPKDDMAPLVQLIVPEVMALKPRHGGGEEAVCVCVCVCVCVQRMPGLAASLSSTVGERRGCLSVFVTCD